MTFAMKNRKHFLGFLCLITLFLGCIQENKAQYSNTSYFMDNVGARSQLNPALRPRTGYIAIPAIGAFTLSSLSNTLSVKEVVDILDTDETFLSRESFLGNLYNENRFNVNLNADIVSFGFYKNNGFWSGNIGFRSDINASVPKSMFEYLYDLNIDEDTEIDDYDIRDVSMYINSYFEIGLGYSHLFNENLTIGGKIKMLLGVSHLKANMDKLRSKDITGVFTKADIDDDEDKKINMKDLIFNDFKITGSGLAIDMGVSYRFNERLTLSAALIDLGVISWSEYKTTSSLNEVELPEDEKIEWNSSLINLEAMGYKLGILKSNTTSLASTFVMGGDISLDDQWSIGILSTTHFGRPKTLSELTFSGNYHPKSWFNLTFSYSVIQSEMKTFGLACKVGPLFIATDYMPLEALSSVNNLNVSVGLSIPLGQSTTDFFREAFRP